MTMQNANITTKTTKTTLVAMTLALATLGWAGNGQAQPPKEGDKPAAEGAAAPHGPPAPPKPAPENDVIKKSVGTWSCEGTGKGPEGQEMKYKSSWTVKPALGGHWYSLVYKRMKMGPMPGFEGNATVGYNVAEKKYVFVGFDNMGGWINLSSSDGAAYSGQGSPMGKVGPVKFTFIEGKDKKGQPSDKAFDMTMDFGVASSSETCKK
jgi:hypothetical protein